MSQFACKSSCFKKPFSLSLYMQSHCDWSSVIEACLWCKGSVSSAGQVKGGAVFFFLTEWATDCPVHWANPLFSFCLFTQSHVSCFDALLTFFSSYYLRTYRSHLYISSLDLFFFLFLHSDPDTCSVVLGRSLRVGLD